jgi:uncharacterized membrane protein
MITRELLDLVLRWLHVIAAIMWIGNSLLFNWLDRNLRPAARPREGSMGEIWLLHSGAFYEVEKTLTPGATLPRPLHWFKWQAYTTWLSGAALLIVVYYMSGAALLLGADANITSTTAIVIGAASLTGGLLLYELLWRSPLAYSPTLATIVSFGLLLALAAALGGVLSGRATFLHIGALMGTIMAANVKTKIVPAQRQQVAAVERGETPDVRLSQQAKLRSIHNNYMTFPVIVLMLSSHSPSFYASDASWIILAVLIVAGAAVRHILNVRFTFRYWIPALATAIVAAATTLLLLGSRTSDAHTLNIADGAAAVVTFDDVQRIVQKRCTVCHSTSPAIRTFGIAPGGAVFETAQDIHGRADRIEARAVQTQTMPPANMTFMTDEERALLAAWLRGSAR